MANIKNGGEGAGDVVLNKTLKPEDQVPFGLIDFQGGCRVMLVGTLISFKYDKTVMCIQLRTRKCHIIGELQYMILYRF